MKHIRDIKPIFNWAIANGEAKIVDRILMKLLPLFVKNELQITEDSIEESTTILVSDEVYISVKNVAEELVGNSFEIQR